MSVFVSDWCFRVCWLVFCGAFQHGLWCASMLPSVTFEYVALREEKFQKKKATFPFSLLPACSCSEVVVCAACTLTTTSMLAAMIAEACFCSDVTYFHLEPVTIPLSVGWLDCLEVLCAPCLRVISFCWVGARLAIGCLFRLLLFRVNSIK